MHTMIQFEKILGHRSVIGRENDCVAMIISLDDEQLSAVRALLSQLLRKPTIQNVAVSAAAPVKTSWQKSSEKEWTSGSISALRSRSAGNLSF